MNANFSELGSKALNRTGGTLSGNMAVNNGVTIDGVDISTYLLGSGKIAATSSASDALAVTGGITAADLTLSDDLVVGDALTALSSTITNAVTAGSFVVGSTTIASGSGLVASALASGTVPTARLGTGIANSTTYLRGDNTWDSPAGVPSGMIAFSASTCPTGWSEYTSARGRVIVGLPSGGTSEGTVGTALTNLQNKTHTHTGPSHSHLIQGNLWTTSTNSPVLGSILSGIDQPDSDGNFNTLSYTTGLSSAPTATSGTGATGTASTSDVISYIQLYTCVKS